MESFPRCIGVSTFQINNDLVCMAKLQKIDRPWASRATKEIDRVLAVTGIRKHADEWVIDCRSTICTVSFDTSLDEYDDEEATRLLTETTFGRVTWRRSFQKQTTDVTLVRSDYSIEP